MTEPTTPTAPTIREADETDVPLVLALIRELAEYERLLHECVATEDDLRRTLFGEVRHAEVLIAEEAGEPVGFALFCPNYSTFLGRPGLHLEDLFVRPAFRGRGLGRALLVHLARLALRRGYGRFEWNVLDWNQDAWRFYRSVGAEPLEEWTTFRVAGGALEALAGS